MVDQDVTLRKGLLPGLYRRAQEGDTAAAREVGRILDKLAAEEREQESRAAGWAPLVGPGQEDGRSRRAEVIERLVAQKVRRDLAAMYTDAWLEYQEASAQIAEHGLVVHPKTGEPVVNPYVALRDGALRKLEGMRNIKAEGLW